MTKEKLEAGNAAMRERQRRKPKPVGLSPQQHSREHWQFVLIGRKLDRYEREIREERYITALYGIRSSWQAVERAGIYFVWRKREAVRTRQDCQGRRHPWSARKATPRLIPFLVPPAIHPPSERPDYGKRAA